MINKIVPDSSIIAKWYRKKDSEKWVDIAHQIRDFYIQKLVDLAVPDLIIYELGNFFRFKGKLSEGEASLAIKSFFDLEIKLFPPLSLIAGDAMKIAFENNISYYDAYFVALSQNIDFHFVTADEKLFKNILSLPKVHLLGDMKFPSDKSFDINITNLL